MKGESLKRFYLEKIVLGFEKISRRPFVSPNVHNLLRLCDDVRKYGPLDDFSAFKFVNYIRRKSRGWYNKTNY